MNLIKITRYTSQNNSNNKKLDPHQERNTNEQSTSRTERTTNPINKTGINQRNVTNNHDQHTDTNIFNSNIIKCNKNQKNKRTRRSNRQKTSKMLNIIYSNARGIKSKTKSINEILFQTQCDIFAITETNLKDKEKVNINGYTWAGKNRASEGGGIGFLINKKIEAAIIIEQQENTNTEIMWIRIQLKRKETRFIGLIYGKQERNNNATLDKEFKIIERHLYQYIANNQNHILLLGDFNAKIGNGEQGIPNGDPHNNTKWEKIDKSNQ